MNLTIRMNGSYVVDRFGNNNSALYLNNGYAMAPPGVYFDCTIGFTAMLWIKLMALGSYPRIFEFSNGMINESFIFCFKEDTSLLMSSTSASTNDNWSIFAYSNAPLTLGVWTHVATTINTIAKIVYINGIQVGSAAGSTCRGIHRTSCKIGRSDFFSGNPDLNGFLDDLKLFNRVLNQSEIYNEMQLAL